MKRRCACRLAIQTNVMSRAEKKILSSYCTMLQMDQNTEDLDPEWLMAYQVKSALVVAGRKLVPPRSAER